ncbi:hypothetical protein EDB86DRAFT_3077730 [Lactarius hatsudake]|nr:hypothetical protein EDB86DRAFT_3077730 [Lactarius hatsudake]
MSLSRMAASCIAKLFKAFSDLEEDAINLMLSMTSVKTRTPTCVIRIEGYKTIVRMSEEQPRWLEWNVDALVQLLQSDEPEEVAVVEVALKWHLQGHPRRPLRPNRASMEDEDKTIHERLRALVAAFLAQDAQDAQKPLLAQLQGQGRGAAEQEDALIDTLIKAVSKSSVADAAKISSSFCPRSTTDDRRGAGTSLYPVHHGQPEAGLSSHVRIHPTSLRSADVQPTHVGGFGGNMGDSPMVVVWPSRGADGEYNFQRLAPPSHVTPDVDLLLGSADESRAFFPPDRTPSTTGARNTRGDAGPASALLQEELAAQLAGQLRRNAVHFSGALGADQEALRAAEETVGANLEVMKQMWVRVHDHRGKVPGTT